MHHLFFFEKIAGALLCHLRRRRRSFTSQVKTNTTTTQATHTNNAHNKTLHHHNLGEEPQANHCELRRHRQCCATLKLRPTASLSGNSKSSSTKWLSLSSRTHTIVDPPAPALLQRNTPVTAPMKITDLGHTAWGSHLIYHLTLHCQMMHLLF
jgi:hypothetical protein